MGDLLSELSDDTKPEAGTAVETVDLLDEIEKTGDAKGWQPEEGGGVEGVVVSRSVTKSDFTTEPIPVVVLRTDAGELWRVVGFQSVLRREIEDADPRIGDRFAAKYFGKRDNKKGTASYHHYKVACRRAAKPQPAEPPPF